MIRLPALAAALALTLGCQKSSSSPPAAVGPAAAPVEDAGTALPDSQGRLALTAEKLDRYLAYQREVLAAETAAAPDGGALALLEQVAAAEEAARRRHRLDEQEIDAIDEMVTDVLDERSYAKAAGLERLITQGEQMTAKLPEDQRADFEAEVAAIKQQRDDAKNLPDERQRHGDANVELLLSREAELTKLWNERLRR